MLLYYCSCNKNSGFLIGKSKEGKGLEAKFPKQMQHSLSEWPLKTFAGGMPKSFFPQWCSQCGDPSPSKMTWSEGRRLPVVSKATGVKEW